LNGNMNQMNMNDYQTVFNIDPFVYQTLMSIIGSNIVVETTNYPIKGKLVDVKPDHIVMEEALTNQMCFIRMKEIVTIIPV